MHIVKIKVREFPRADELARANATLKLVKDEQLTDDELRLADFKAAIADVQSKIKELEAEREEFMARQKFHLEWDCRLVGCSSIHPRGRESGSSRKERRGRQLFCGAHSGLKNTIGKENFRRLAANELLRVAA